MPRLIVTLDLPDSAAGQAPDAVALTILGTSGFKHDACWADDPDDLHLAVVANAIGYEVALHLGREPRPPRNTDETPTVAVTSEEARMAVLAARRALSHLGNIPHQPDHERQPAPGYCNQRPHPDSIHICDHDPRHQDGTHRCRCGHTWPTQAR